MHRYIGKKRKEISSLLNLKPNKITFEKLIKKYIDFLKFYEMIFRNYISQESNKIYVIRKIFACIQSFNNGGQYSVISNGSIHYISYVPSSDLKAYIDTKTEQYENELVKLDDDFRQQRVKQKQNEEKILQQQAEYKKQKAKEMKSNIPLIIDLILSLGCILFIGLFILVALLETKVVSLIIYGVAIFISLPFILLKNIPQIKKVGPLYQVIIAIARYIIMFILFFIGTILLGELVSPYVGETFISDNLNIEINITQEFVKIVNKEENYTEELFYYEEETEDGYIINIIETTLDDTTTNESKGTEEKVIAQYKYVTEKESLCLFEDKTCKEYYTKIKESQK